MNYPWYSPFDLYHPKYSWIKKPPLKLIGKIRMKNIVIDTEHSAWQYMYFEGQGIMYRQFARFFKEE